MKKSLVMKEAPAMYEAILVFLDNIVLENIYTLLITSTISVLVGFLYTTISYNSVAQKALQGEKIRKSRKAYRVFKNFVKPNFIPISYESSKKVLKYKDIWNNIINDDDAGSTGLFIYAEAGQGKTRLLQYLYFKLLMRDRRFKLLNKSSEKSHVFHDRFNQYDSLEALLSKLKELKNSGIQYVLLDGFDEFKALSRYQPDELFDLLFEEIKNIGSFFTKIIISSRIELLSLGEVKLKNASIWEVDGRGVKNENPIDIIKIKHLNDKQIISTFKNRIVEAEKVSYLKKIRDVRLLKKHLKKTKGKHSLFRNSFFATMSDRILNALDEQEIEQLTIEQAFTIIVDDCVHKEYETCANLQIINKKEMNEEKFKNMLIHVLMHMAITMIETDHYYVTNEQLPAEYINYIHTRAMLIRNEDKLQFIHRMFFEYFLACGIQKLEFKDKLAILSGQKPEIDKESVIRFYTNCIVSNNECLSYSFFQIKDAIDDDITNTYKSMYRLITSSKLKVRINTPLHINQILDIFPLAAEVQFAAYTLVEGSITEYMCHHELDLSSQGLRELNHLEAFGDIDLLDIVNNEIRDLKPMLYLKSIRTLWIPGHAILNISEISSMSIEQIFVSISSIDQLTKVISQSNIMNYNFRIKGAKPKDIALLIPEILLKMETGLYIKVINTFNKLTINTVFYYISSKGYENEIDRLSAIIHYFDSLYAVALRSGFDDNNYDAMPEIRYVRSTYYSKRGEVFYYKKHQYTDALYDYSKAIELDPNNDKLYHMRAHALAQLKEYERALEEMSRAINLMPTVPYYYSCKGDILHSSQQYNSALAYINKAIELDPNNAEFYRNRGKVLHELEEYEKALEDYSKAIELKSTVSTYYRDRELTLRVLQHHEKALQDESIAIELEARQTPAEDAGHVYSLDNDGVDEVKFAELLGQLPTEVATRVVTNSVPLIEMAHLLGIVGVPTSTELIPADFDQIQRIAIQPYLEVGTSFEQSFLLLVEESLRSTEEKNLEGLELTKAYLPVDSFDDLKLSLKVLAIFFNKIKEMNAVLTTILNKENELIKLAEGKQLPSVLLMIGTSDSFMVMSERSYLGSLVGKLNADNIATSVLKVTDTYSAINMEDVVAADPDIILVLASGDHGAAVDKFDKEVAANYTWSKLSAYKNNKIHILDYSIFGVASISNVDKALTQIATYFYE